MSITARDLLPLVSKLSREEKVLLARLALAAASETPGADAKTYRAIALRDGEFSSDEDHLSWDADGWEQFGGAG